ncbi:MAG TPA: ribonuclease domain-containing protein [Nocardioides sp.]|nr:ribonuclease domain-containing protein [Nocardioides sp.]
MARRPAWLTPGVAGAGSGLAAAVVALVAWLAQQGGTAPTAEPPTPAPTSAYAAMPSVDPRSGLPYVALEALPPEAADTVRLIDAGGPFPYDQDDSIFGNYEGLLPEESDDYYREYTVETPGSDDRGARRIIGGADGELYWTDDHYASFEVIWR